MGLPFICFSNNYTQTMQIQFMKKQQSYQKTYPLTPKGESNQGPSYKENYSVKLRYATIGALLLAV